MVQVCDEARKTVLIAVPDDPMSAIRRLVLNGGFHHRSIREMGQMAEAWSVSSARCDGKDLGRNDCHRTTFTVRSKIETRLQNVSVTSEYLFTASLFKAKAGRTFHFCQRTRKYERLNSLMNERLRTFGRKSWASGFGAYRNDGTGPDAWPCDSDQYLILTLAIGGNWGGQKGQ
jgi:hypothetical protein